MKLHSLVPSFKLSELFSYRNPLVWYLCITIIALMYIIIDHHNEKLFLSIFNLTGNNQLLNNTMQFGAAYLFIVILVIAFIWYAITQKSKYIVVGLSYGIVGIIAYILSKFGTHSILDVRPYIEYHLTPLISVAKDNGFPSDHTMLSMAVASVTSLYSKTMGWILFALGFIVAFARVYVAAHHPLDVIGSMVIVAISLILFIGSSKLMKYFLDMQEIHN